MANVSIGGAVGEGFSLIRRQPGAVALWAVIVLVLLAVRVAVYIPIYSAMFSAFVQGAQAGNRTPPDFQSMMPMIQQVQALSLLMGLVQVLVYAVLACAVYRAVLQPENNRLGFLRLGGTELSLAVFYFGFGIALFIGVFVLAIVVAIPIGIISAMAGQGAAGAAAVSVILIMLVILGAALWFGLRLSMVGPMLVAEGQIRLGEAWAMTRGHVGALFGVAVVLIVLLVAAEVVILAATLAAVFAAIGPLGANSPLAHASLPEILGRLSPALVVFGVGWTLLIGLLTPILQAPWARIYSDLRRTDLAATFG
jgi:hypothetical protein